MTKPASEAHQHRTCEACGGRSIRALLDCLSHAYSHEGDAREWPYRLLECQSCGLGFVDPKPTWQLLQTFYDAKYGNFDSSKSDPSEDAHSFKYRLARSRLRAHSSDGLPPKLKASSAVLVEWTTGRTIPYTLSVPLQLQKQASIIDIGYGSGQWLLSMAELGYKNLHGYDIEANEANCERLRKNRIEVTSGPFLKNEYPDECFDCVRLDHVFEHVVEPGEVLLKCHKMLKPGGFLVMSLPCKNSWSMKLSLVKSPALQLPKHLYHHTQVSVRLLLQGTGFIPIKIQAYSVASQLGQTANNVLHDFCNLRLPLFMFEMLSPPYRLFGALTRRGDFMSVWARKPNSAEAVRSWLEGPAGRNASKGKDLG